jgi:predicted dehydrogenase
MGDFTVEYATRHNLVHDYEVEDGCSAVFKLANGATGHAYFSWNSKTWIDRFEIVGSEGKIIADPLDGPDLTLIKGREREEVSFPVPENAHLPCIEDFVAAVLDGRTPASTGYDGLFVNRILAEIEIAAGRFEGKP